MDIAALRDAHPEHWQMAAAIRALALDGVAAANSGHTGMPIGMADIATVLWTRHLKFDAADPKWPDRDRFVLSNGHGSMLIYSLLHLTGFQQMTLQQLKDFRQWGSVTAGHPESGHTEGVETTTGPLGQGIANAVGFAIAEEMLRARFGAKVFDHHTYVFAGDGCLMEGVSQEAIALAGKQELGRLVVFFDDNSITIDGSVSLSDATDQTQRFEASGWHVQEIDGHDPDAIDAAIVAAKADPRPSMIACKTHIALGHAAQDTAKGHGALTDNAQLLAAKELYGWPYGPFEVPGDIKSRWEEAGKRGASVHADWQTRIDALPQGKRAKFDAAVSGEVPKKLTGVVRALKKQMVETAPKLATRAASQKALEVINPVFPETVGGSADLTGSNNTLTSDLGIFSPDDRNGRYIHYGVREHGMAAAMNGLALHGGIRPYGGTFMVFSDYARGALRLSALMSAPVIYVLSHDSIGLGEDGPTHQPVEHLAALRAIPDLVVLRPADAVETAEAWEIALSRTNGPTILALSRQGLPTVRTENKSKNLSSMGAYTLIDATEKRQAVLMATGSEVAIAMEAREALEAEGIGTRVVSVPSMELFAEQDESYRRRILPAGAVRVAIEAGVRQPWDRWLLGERGREAKSDFVGMTGFGASAPQDVLYREFGITAEATVAKVKALLG